MKPIQVEVTKYESNSGKVFDTEAEAINDDLWSVLNTSDVASCWEDALDDVKGGWLKLEALIVIRDYLNYHITKQQPSLHETYKKLEEEIDPSRPEEYLGHF